MIQKEKILVLMSLTNSLDEAFKDLEKAQDSNDYPKFDVVKRNIKQIQQEISQILGQQTGTSMPTRM